MRLNQLFFYRERPPGLCQWPRETEEGPRDLQHSKGPLHPHMFRVGVPRPKCLWGSLWSVDARISRWCLFFRFIFHCEGI